MSAITGATIMRIIRAVLAGERDPAALAALRDQGSKRRGRRSVRHWSATTGRSTSPPCCRRSNYLLQAVELYDAYQAKVVACDARIEAALEEIEAACPPPASPIPEPRHRTKQPNVLAFPAREALHCILGVDLIQLYGLSHYLALKRVGECSTNLSARPTAKQFTS